MHRVVMHTVEHARGRLRAAHAPPLCWAAGFVLFGALSLPASAQNREIVSSRVEISSRVASLVLEFADGAELSLDLDDGLATLDGRELGRYEPGGSADQAWRSLLDEVLALPEGRVAGALAEWSPDVADAGAEAELLHEIVDALGAARDGTIALTAREPDGALDELTGRAERALAEARALEEQLRAVGQDDALRRLEMEQQETLRGLERALERLAELDESLDPRDLVDIDEIRDEVRREVRRELEAELGRASAQRFRTGPFGWVGSAFGVAMNAMGRAVQSVMHFLFLGFLTVLATRLAGPRIDTVTREIGHRPGRAAVVGVAGGVLAMPVYVIGAVFLAITIIGILGLVVWLPFFPLALAVAAFAGCVGVFHHVGEWVLSRHDLGWLDRFGRVDRANSATVRVIGLAALLAPIAVGGVVEAVPLVGWLGTALRVVGCMVLMAASLVGLGAVIVTRAGAGARWRWESTGEYRAPDPYRDDAANVDAEFDLGVDDAHEDQAPEAHDVSSDAAAGAAPRQDDGDEAAGDGAAAGDDHPEAEADAR